MVTLGVWMGCDLAPRELAPYRADPSRLPAPKAESKHAFMTELNANRGTALSNYFRFLGRVDQDPHGSTPAGALPGMRPHSYT